MSESKTNKNGDGLGSNPLNESDPVAHTLYGGGTSKSSKGRKPTKEGQSWRLVTFSFYEEDVERLDELLAEAKRRGFRKVNRSQLMRFALSRVDLDDFPRSI